MQDVGVVTRAHCCKSSTLNCPVSGLISVTHKSHLPQRFGKQEMATATIGLGSTVRRDHTHTNDARMQRTGETAGHI